MVEYQVWIDWGTGEVALHNFSGRNLIRDTSFSKDVSLHKDLKPVEDKCSFTIDFVQSIANTLLTLDYDQIITVRINEVVDGSASAWFYGYVRPVTKYSIDLDDRVIEIEALDNSWRLKRKPSTQATYTDQRLDTVVNTILTAAGYSSTERSMVPSLSDNVARITWQAYDDEWEDTLTELLYAYGYLYYFDESGRFRVYAWITDTLSVADVFNDNNIIGRLEVDRDDERTGIKFTPGAPTEEIRITQYETRTVDNVELVSLAPNALSLTATPTAVPSIADNNFGASIDEIEDATGVTNINVTAVSNAYVVSNWKLYIATAFNKNQYKTFTHTAVDSILTTFTIDSSNFKSGIQFTAPTTSGGESVTFSILQSFSLFADLEIRGVAGEYTIEVPQGLDDKIDNPYIDFGTTQAQRIGTALTDRAATAIYSYQGRSESFFAIGQYVQVQSTDLNIDTVGRVINRRHVYESGLVFYEYEIEGAKAIGSLVGTVTPINGTQVITSAGTTSVTGTVNSGLNPDGSIRRPITGSSIQDTETIDGDVYTFSPGENGLLFNSTSLGFYNFDTDSWPVQIQNDDGVGKAYFGDGSTKYMEWDGTNLNISGAANIDGKITAGNGIESADYDPGVAGWRIDGDGTAEFESGNFRGDITGAIGTFSGAITAASGAIGGFDITATTIEATDGSIKIDSDERRLEIRSAAGQIKTADGYLDNIIKADGTSFPAGSFGQYVGAGSTVYIESDEEYADGTHYINADAAFVSRDGDVEIVRLGSDNGGDVVLNVGALATISQLRDDTGSILLADDGTDLVSRTTNPDAPGMFFSVADGRLRLNAELEINSTIGGRTALQILDDIDRIDLDLSSLGALAYLEQVEAAQLGDTIISGGFILTSLLDVVSIFAEEITLGATGYIKSANYVAGTSGFKIDAATETIDIVDGTFSGTVSAGTITGTTISGGTISGSTVSGADIEGGTIEIGLSGPGVPGFSADVDGITVYGGSMSSVDINGGEISGATISGAIWDLTGFSGYKQNISPPSTAIDHVGFVQLYGTGWQIYRPTSIETGPGGWVDIPGPCLVYSTGSNIRLNIAGARNYAKY